MNPAEYTIRKSIIAWVSDEPMVYDRLTPYEYLEFVAGLWRIDAGTAEALRSVYQKLGSRLQTQYLGHVRLQVGHGTHDGIGAAVGEFLDQS